MAEAGYDVVVVGAGAAGAVLAARLAEGGLSVLVLEAGGDPCDPADDPGGDASGGRPLAADYRVPAFHAFASEHRGLAHDYRVWHYDDPVQRARDWRNDEAAGGVLYPRVRGLGGCTAHNAMIVVRPNDADWNHIAETMGDPSWRASAMQGYWERIERCRTRWFPWRWLARLTGWNPTGHGWRGWMTTEVALPLRAVLDRGLRRDMVASIHGAADAQAGVGIDWESHALDPNDRRLWNRDGSGIKLLPMSTRRHARHGARERLRAAEARHPDRLTVRLHAEVTGIELRDGRAVAVRFRAGGVDERVTPRREIVLAGGAFASPQLLLLSGIGDPDHLAAVGVDCRHPLPGVGCNLQDRYEIGVVSRMRAPWRTLAGVEYSTNDLPYRLWRWLRVGNYKSNGLVLSALLRSRAGLAEPDLACFSLLADFRGYYPGYSEAARQRDRLTWVVLKAYAANNAGSVRLRSADPAAPPAIRFRYFEEGSPGWEADLDAMVSGIRFVRRIADALGERVAEEQAPGRGVSSDEALRAHVRNNAWGHHACGTCAMKPLAAGGVVDSRFRVHGLAGLRVVDASIFPRIPGYFPVAAISMVAEKAADVLLAEVGHACQPG
jgi:choline dehydrogenase